MDEYEHAYKIFKIHSKLSFPSGLPDKFSALEMGPGDSIASAIMAYAFGATNIYLMDVGSFATKDLDIYKNIATKVKEAGYKSPDISKAKTIDDVLTACNASYITTGLDGYKEIPSDSIDLIWSHSVLEHVRKADFDNFMRQTRRIIKPSGYISHIIDLQDHLDHNLNNLRFSEKLWESKFLSSSGFYTNRMRYYDIANTFQKAGFEILDTSKGRWDTLPLSRQKMASPYSRKEIDELKIRTCSFRLKPV